MAWAPVAQVEVESRRHFMRIRWQRLLLASVGLGLGVLAACSVEVLQGPPAGVGGAGGSAGSAGAGGLPADASPEGAATDAPPADAPTADGSGSDAAGDVVNTDIAIDGPATDASTTLDAPSDAADASVADGSTADAGTTDGALADAPADATGACFAEDIADGGSTTSCAMLPYFGTLCRDDAGIDGPPAGAALCETLDTDLKVSAFQELFACLRALPGADGGLDACSSAHEQGSADCSRNIFGRTMCPVPDGAAEGGLYGCAQIAASCGPDSGDGGISVELCRGWLGPFNGDVRQGIIDCYLDPVDVGATSCRDKFENYCVFP
jgi:hypothetical protein